MEAKAGRQGLGPRGIANAPARRKARAAASRLTVEDVVQYARERAAGWI